MNRIYPDSKVEIQGFAAKFYDSIMNLGSFGLYHRFITNAVKAVKIGPTDQILDLGCGTGRNARLMSKYISEKGNILGLEISDLMISQFKVKNSNLTNIKVQKQRIDLPFTLDHKFDKVFISFVLHGFPFDIQKQIIKNAYNNLKENGEFIILDFNEFALEKTPFYFRIPFKFIECKYAFEFVERDWKDILLKSSFIGFEEKLFSHKYIRLLKAKKQS